MTKSQSNFRLVFSQMMCDDNFMLDRLSQSSESDVLAAIAEARAAGRREEALSLALELERRKRQGDATPPLAKAA